MVETLPSILHKLNNQNFSVNNKTADFDWLKLFGKSNLTINGREACGFLLARCIGLSEGLQYYDKLSRNSAQLTTKNNSTKPDVSTVRNKTKNGRPRREAKPCTPALVSIMASKKCCSKYYSAYGYLQGERILLRICRRFSRLLCHNNSE
jgi:hypothetical protein